jgi:hypothetical protein
MSDIQNPAPIDPIEVRRSEVAQYDANVALYTSILASLPSTWPSNLEKFKSRTDHQQAVTECDDADVELLSQLLYMEQVRKSIRAEKLERTKAAAILAALEA